MKIGVHEAEKLSLEQIRLLVTASEGIRFESEHRQMYGWVEPVLIQQEYLRQGKLARGLLRRSGLEIEALQRGAAAVSDTECAQRMQRAKAQLFEQFRSTA